jgi:hypothetical protein
MAAFILLGRSAKIVKKRCQFKSWRYQTSQYLLKRIREHKSGKLIIMATVRNKLSEGPPKLDNLYGS